MKKIIPIIMLFAASVAAQNLTPSQKDTDFRQLVDTMNHWYAPLDWKKELFEFDALQLQPWLSRVAQTRTDLEYYELCVEYIASLQDTHSFYQLPSNFVARLGFSVDIFDGKVLIDGIDRNLLPMQNYPFLVGDEIVSVDGVDAEQFIQRHMKYTPQGNPSATRRLAATRISVRAQAVQPNAASVGDQAMVVIRRQNGAEESYDIRWTKTGVPLEVGRVPDIGAGARSKQPASAVQPDYMEELERLRYSGVSPEQQQFGVLNYGSRNPIFLAGMGPNFTRRLGGAPADFFYSGVFEHDGLKIGFLRIPSYSPPSIPVALQQLDTEIMYFDRNTDGLVIDQMRNTGGNLCFGESVMQRLSPNSFWTTGFELRAMYWRVMTYYSMMINAKANNASPDVIQQYELLYQAMAAANAQSRGVTDPIPICASSLWRDPVREPNGNMIAYTKPIMMMIDEFSTSTGDSVPSMFQENRRGVLFGQRSNGAGGNNTSIPVGGYTEGRVGVTMGIQARHTPVSVPGYPRTNRLENVGVHPDLVRDYMTKENLLLGGAPYVRQFLDHIAAYVRQQQSGR